MNDEIYTIHKRLIKIAEEHPDDFHLRTDYRDLVDQRERIKWPGPAPREGEK